MEDKRIHIAIGSDHGGFNLKEILSGYLNKQGYSISDCGTKSTDSVDYPEYAGAVATKVSTGECDFGIVIDGAGIGSAMVANKYKGVRAAMCYDLSTARNAREHNNANVLSLGAGFTGPELAKQICDIFLTHSCSEGRHLKRVGMINKLDVSLPLRNESVTAEAGHDNISRQDMARIAEKVGVLLKENKIQSGTNVSCTENAICACGTCVEIQPDMMRRFLDYGVSRFGYHDASCGECVPEDIARCIDHTLLKPDATESDIKRLCAEAREFKFATVCVSPSYVSLAATELAGSSVLVCTVVGFPSGAHAPEIKAMETRQAIRNGAREIDMVINVGALKSGNDDLVYRDIRMVCEACEDGGAVSKVIIEAALLNDQEKIRACELAKKARANFVKTSTGFGPGGATADDVALMRKVVGFSKVGVKAAGGIRSYEDAQKMIAAGANRIGASAGIKILQQAKSVTVSN